MDDNNYCKAENQRSVKEKATAADQHHKLFVTQISLFHRKKEKQRRVVC